MSHFATIQCQFRNQDYLKAALQTFNLELLPGTTIRNRYSQEVHSVTSYIPKRSFINVIRQQRGQTPHSADDAECLMYAPIGFDENGNMIADELDLSLWRGAARKPFAQDLLIQYVRQVAQANHLTVSLPEVQADDSVKLVLVGA